MGRRRSSNHHLPIRMLHRDGIYYHVVTVRRKQRWSTLGRDYGEALRQWAIIEGRDRPTPRTVGDVMRDYLTASTGQLADETLRGYAQSAKRLGKWLGEMDVRDLTKPHIARYVDRERRIYANRDRAFLGAAWSYAQRVGNIPDGPNPCHAHGKRVAEPPRRRYVTDAELERLLAAALPKPFMRPRPDGRTQPARTFWLLIRFAYLTGMSEGDICRLQVTAGTDAGILRVRQKTDAEGLIAWSDELRAVWREAAGDRIGAQPLFRARGGDAYTTDGLRATWAKVRAKAGLSDVRFHDLRRKAGSDVEADHATELLQHADPAVTRKHYRAKLRAVKPVR